MKTVFLFAMLAAGTLALAACGEDKPAPVVRETRVVHHYHATSRSSTPDNPSDFEPVERPATYSR